MVTGAITLFATHGCGSAWHQNAEALTRGLTLNRIEDGAFDPKQPNDFYFVTTAGGNGPPAVHNVAEYVQRGELMRMHVDDWKLVYGS